MAKVVYGDLPRTFYNLCHDTGVVGLDTETTGLDHIVDRLATVQVYTPEETVIVRGFSNHPSNLSALIESERIRKVIHYAGFDLAFLIRDFDVRPRNIFDTKIAAKLLDNERVRYNKLGKGNYSLKTLVKYYFNIELNKGEQLSNWLATTLTPQQIEYAENDVKYLPRLAAFMQTELINAGLWTAAQAAFDYVPTDVMLKLKGFNDVFGY